MAATYETSLAPVARTFDAAGETENVTFDGTYDAARQYYDEKLGDDQAIGQLEQAYWNGYRAGKEDALKPARPDVYDEAFDNGWAAALAWHAEQTELDGICAAIAVNEAHLAQEKAKLDKSEKGVVE